MDNRGKYRAMNTAESSWGLPDPIHQAGFYRDVSTKRLVAFVVDSILITVITILLIPLTAFTALLFFGFLGGAVALVYRTASLANGSATPGMRLMGIEFRTRLGERLDLATAFVHTTLFLFSLSMVFPQVISVILMLTSGRGQGLSDFLLGTAVINRAARH